MRKQYDIYTYDVVCMPSLPFCQQICGPSAVTDHREGLRRFVCLLDEPVPLCEYARDSPSGRNLFQKDWA